MSQQALSAIIIGAGNRGTNYGRYALQHPQELSIVGVAEPATDRLQRMVTQHDIAPTMQFATWEDALAQGKVADIAINTTMDRMHHDSTLALLDAGYDVLLEKPMSPVLEENVRLVQHAEEQGRLLQVCHVLRYAPFWQTIRQIVQSGKLGRIISVSHRENLHFLHMAHSFVRGNWRNEATSGAMILAKCCHDFDILNWILGQHVKTLHSFGALTYFRPENAPEGAAERCIGCSLAETCKYYAPRRYAQDGNSPALDAVEITPTAEARMKALETSPYGRCVWHCDNDVVDHQTVSMLLEDETTVTLIMQGQGDEECRTMRYDGTLGTLYAKFAYGNDEITIHHHSGEVEQVVIPDTTQMGGHGGGDFGIVRSFLNAMNGQPDDSITTARESLESHLLAFAAEESRLNNTVIDMAAYRAKAEAAAKNA